MQGASEAEGARAEAVGLRQALESSQQGAREVQLRLAQQVRPGSGVQVTARAASSHVATQFVRG